MRWYLDEAAAETWSVRTLQRNRLIAQALYDMGVIEHYGRGIKRIKEECDRNGNPYPDWTDRPGEFLTIYKVRGGEEVQTGQHRELNEGNEGNREGNPVGNEGSLERVFNAIKSNPHATIAELENVLGVSHATVERAQKSLQEAGRIRRVGGTRGHWEVQGY